MQINKTNSAFAFARQSKASAVSYLLSQFSVLSVVKMGSHNIRSHHSIAHHTHRSPNISLGISLIILHLNLLQGKI